MKYNYETCAASAKRFSTKRDFRRHENYEYQWLQRNGLLESACAHMDTLCRNLSDGDILNIASKYSSRKAFSDGDQGAYQSAIRRKILDQACEHMQISPRFSYKKWTQVDVLAEAAKYGSRSAFKRGCAGAYEHALSNGYLEQACAHMRDGAFFWHVFELMAVAVKYRNWGLFIKAEPQAYTFAHRSKLADLASTHMSRRRERDRAPILEEAKKYKTRSMFWATAPGAYKHALANEFLDEACAHMEVKKRAISKEFVLGVALQFKTRSDFQRADPSAYCIALRDGYIDEACAHMEIRRRDIDREFALVEAKKYTSRSQFKMMEPGCHAHANRNGFLDEACAHMRTLRSGFKDAGSAVLYHLRISGPNGMTLFKIGITNRTPEFRIKSLYLSEGFSAEVLDAIPFESGRDARIAEKRIHRRLAAYRYAGPPIMNNGNTELFTVPAFSEPA